MREQGAEVGCICLSPPPPSPLYYSHVGTRLLPQRRNNPCRSSPRVLFPLLITAHLLQMRASLVTVLCGCHAASDSGFFVAGFFSLHSRGTYTSNRCHLIYCRKRLFAHWCISCYSKRQTALTSMSSVAPSLKK